MPRIVPAIRPAVAGPSRRLSESRIAPTRPSPRRTPWGVSAIVAEGDGHRVEHITIAADGTIPAHFHRHRSEHWTVVAGEAEVLLGDDVLILAGDDSLYVPAGVAHGVRALGGREAALVTVHFGDIVSDDDEHAVTL